VDDTARSAHRTAAFISSLHFVGRVGEGVLGNDLEPVTRRLFPAFDQAIQKLRERVPEITMTGTGAGLFAVFQEWGSAKLALDSVRDLGFPAWISHPVPAD
jgi:4-diphosphocytidyl-2C-methyl-D-erythritol kinase